MAQVSDYPQLLGRRLCCSVTSAHNKVPNHWKTHDPDPKQTSTRSKAIEEIQRGPYEFLASIKVAQCFGSHEFTQDPAILTTADTNQYRWQPAFSIL